MPFLEWISENTAQCEQITANYFHRSFYFTSLQYYFFVVYRRSQKYIFYEHSVVYFGDARCLLFSLVAESHLISLFANKTYASREREIRTLRLKHFGDTWLPYLFCFVFFINIFKATTTEIGRNQQQKQKQHHRQKCVHEIRSVSCRWLKINPPPYLVCLRSVYKSDSKYHKWAMANGFGWFVVINYVCLCWAYHFHNFFLLEQGM